MKIAGEKRIHADTAAVWFTLTDLPALQDVLAGVADITETEAGLNGRRFRFQTDRVVIGPLTTSMHGMIELSRVRPMTSYRVEISGEAGPSALINANVDVTLSPTGTGSVLAYHGFAAVGGRFIRIGDAVLTATARKHVSVVLDRLATRMEAFSRVVGPSNAAGRVVPGDDTPPDERGGAVCGSWDRPRTLPEAPGPRLLGGPMMWGWLALAAGIVAIVAVR